MVFPQSNKLNTIVYLGPYQNICDITFLQKYLTTKKADYLFINP